MKVAVNIIPNEEILNSEEFYRVINEDNNERHAMKIWEFIEENNLEEVAKNLDLDKNDCSGFDCQIGMASIGHVVICYDEEIWVFLPQNLSTGQKNWFNQKRLFFKENGFKTFYAIVDNEQTIIESADYSRMNEDKYESLYNFVDNSFNYEESIKK